MRKIIFSLLILTLLLTACAFPSRAGRRLLGSGEEAGAASPSGAATTQPEPTPAQPTDEPREVVEQPEPSAEPSDSVLSAAEQSVRDYFSALEAGETQTAADRLSTFSLMVAGITRGDAAAELNRQRAGGQKWSELEIVESRAFNDTTALIHVRYTLETPAAATATPTAAAPTPTVAKDTTANQEIRDELWPVRSEMGQWRCNWQNLIDYRTPETSPQTMNGITLKPVRMLRYSDRMQMVLIVQNRTNESIVFGQTNEILATFSFDSQQVEATSAQYIFERLRSYPDVRLEVPGLWEEYPTQVEIRKWKGLQVEPWYRFEL